jgi:cytochrome P450
MSEATAPEASWQGVNFLDPEQRDAFRDDPYTPLAHLREVDPVNLTPLGVWRVSRYEDVLRLLREKGAGVRRTDGVLPGSENLYDFGPQEFMLGKDPPDHTRLRKLVSKAFTPRAIETLRHRAQEIVDVQVEDALARGSMDVIRDLALPVPSTLICEMMGVPTADRDRFTAWTSAVTHLLASFAGPPEPEALEGGAHLGEYFTQLIAERRKAPGDDILSELILAEEEGDRLSEMELLSQAVGLLIAGFETTIGLIGNGIRALLRHPDQLQRLRDDPGLITTAVEECLRFDGPIPLTLRVAHEDLRFGDRTIPKDAIVMAMLAAANRDPAQFDDPDRFDIGRDPNPHVAFGGGAHLCLGAHLARMEAAAAIGTLVRRTPTLELEDDTLEWGPSLFRVLARLPVRLGA